VSANRLLVIDDEPDVAAFVAEVAGDLGFVAHALSDPLQFEAELARVNPTVIVLDLQMPGLDGIEVLRMLGEQCSPADVIIASGMDSRVLTTAAQLGRSLELSVPATLAKPIALDQLELVLARLKRKERVLTADALALAIESGQLMVHYQPKVTLKGPGRWVIEGAEALVRWQHDEHGLIYPNEFIPIAEANGLITGVTDAVFRAAMEQARVWTANGLTMELAVNLSAQFLTDLEFPDRLLTLVRENNLDPQLLSLELTEIAAMRDPDVTMDILARLRVKGINLCIDDFGTGYSSLTQLYRMPFSELNIDTSFTAELADSEEARAMVEGLIFLAHKLKMKACAEGVENEKTLDILERMGCDRAQGFFIGEAVAAKKLEALVEKWNSRFMRPALTEVG
jgi:EAL domain-containing protein (putative c-di-GMP-specific phosphodiesterase class I)/ActR/RegA family two-component response regulator